MSRPGAVLGAQAFLVVPIKPFVGGKQRLAADLPDQARQLLSRALATRMLRCVAEVWPSGRAVVVGDDLEIAELCARLGLATVPDAGAGQSAAVRAGQAWCLERGATTLATLAGDLPEVDSSDLRQVLQMAEQLAPRSLTLFPDREGTGTNGMIFTPAGLDPFSFGPDSLRRHREWALREGIAFRVAPIRGLAWDVDRPADLVGSDLPEGGAPHPVLAWALGLAERPLVRAGRLTAWAVPGIPEIRAGQDLGELVLGPLTREGGLQPWDVLVVTHKVVSKAEGRVFALAHFEPRPEAFSLGAQLRQDPRMVEAILQESARVIRAESGILVTETHHGLVCANAGVDRSNVGGGTSVTLLPQDPDRSAQGLRQRWLGLASGGPLAVVISDTFGRPFREGAVNVAIGVAGMPALSDHRGLRDAQGYELHASTIGSADEIASIGELVMGKIEGLPVAVVRGLSWSGPETGSAPLLRDPSRDIFRR
jgi:coenzyme F420-0:L-glutamate ligase/coenzyme F420-1:gamma-L-glutamate ligase